MSDLMLIGVLGMPMPDNPADLDAITFKQFVYRARQAAKELQARSDEIERLRGVLEAVTTFHQVSHCHAAARAGLAGMPVGEKPRDITREGGE